MQLVFMGTPAVLGDSDTLRNSDRVELLGCPRRKWFMKSSGGIINTRFRSLKRPDINLIFYSACAVEGCSGGPVVNAAGEVVGMNSLSYAVGDTDEDSFGLAIPINEIKKALPELCK